MKRRSKTDASSLDQAYLEEMSPTESTTRDEGSRRVDADWGAITFEVAGDASLVTLTSLISKYDSKPATEDQVLSALRESGIVHGIKGAALFDVVNAPQGPAGWRGQVEVAAATPPKGGGRISYPPLDGLSGIDHAAIKRVLETGEVGDEAPKAVVVQPGTTLVRVDETGTIVLGKDVFGNPIEPDIALGPEAGENVTVTPDGVTYQSEVYGYVVLDDGAISVASPVHVDEDLMTASFINLGVPSETAPVPADLTQALESAGVTSGIDANRLEQLCDSLGQGESETRITIAQSGEGVPGKDAYLDFTFDVSEKPGEVLPDGSIDLRTRNRVHNIEAGDLIATKIEATDGSEGYRLDGTKIEAGAGKDIEPSAGKGARLETSGGEIRIFADRSGAVQIRGNNVSVSEVLRIEGDVDYDQGNVDFDQDVYVNGSVRSEFSVSAGGDLNIGGFVESGATIRSTGNTIVSKGIMGETTTIVVLGDLKAQFIQNATVLAKGDITIGSYIHNARVRCGGVVKVENNGGQRGGGITGGTVFATRGIAAGRVGSFSTSGTTVGIQPEPEMAAKLTKVRDAIKQSDEQITKMMRSLGLRTFEPEAIERFISRVPAEKKSFYINLLQKLSDLVKFRKTSESEEKSLAELVEQSVVGGKISVTECLFGGSRVAFGETERVFREDTKTVVLTLKENRIVSVSA